MSGGGTPSVPHTTNPTTRCGTSGLGLHPHPPPTHAPPLLYSEPAPPPPCPHRQMRKILSEADENDDDVIQYREFLPVMVDLLQTVKVRGGRAYGAVK